MWHNKNFLNFLTNSTTQFLVLKTQPIIFGAKFVFFMQGSILLDSHDLMIDPNCLWGIWGKTQSTLISND